MIRPERHDRLVRHQARGRGQGGDGAECPRRREGRRERRAPGGRGRHETPDRAVVQIDDQHVAVRRIDSEGTDPGERRQLLHPVGSDRLRAVGTQRPDASACEIGKEVVAVQGRQARAPRDDAAGDRLAGGARVIPDRGDERGGRRWIGPRARDVALAVVPAVVAAAHDEVDFLARPLADVGTPELTVRGVEGDAPRIAQSGRPELGAHRGRIDRGAEERGGADKGIVRGHGIGAGVHRRVRRGRKRARPLVDVEAHNAGEEVAVDALAVLEGVVRRPFVTEREVEVTVRPKQDLAAVVVARLIPLTDQRHLGGRIGGVGLGGGHPKARQPVVQTAAGPRRGRDRVPDKKAAVGRVVGVEGEGEQTAFIAQAGGDRHPGREIEKQGARRCGRGHIRDDPDPPGFFDDKEPARVPRRADHRNRLTERQSRKSDRGGVGRGRRRRRQRQAGRRHPRKRGLPRRAGRSRQPGKQE
jgi:hypothetical protein